MFLSDLSRYGFLLKELVRRDFQGRYAGSLFGVLWSFAQPLWLLILYSIVFSTVMKIPLYGQRSDNFAIWMFCGLLPWMAVQESVSRGATVISDNGSLVKKLNFPSELLVVSIVVSALLHEAVAAGVFLLVLGGLGQFPGGGLAWLLPAIILQVLMTIGLVFLTASVNVFFRDTAQVLGMLLNGWFFLTPIVYPLSLAQEAHPWLISLLTLNPLTSLVELYRCAFLGGGMDAGLLWGVGRLTVVALVSYALGRAVYGKLRPAFVDLI